MKILIIGGTGTISSAITRQLAAEGFIGLLGNPHAIGETYQIMSDESLTWNQIYQSIADALGAEFKPYYVASELQRVWSKVSARLLPISWNIRSYRSRILNSMLGVTV